MARELLIEAVTEGGRKLKMKKRKDPERVFINMKFKKLREVENKATGNKVSLKSFAIQPAEKVWREYSSKRKREWERLHEMYLEKLKEFKDEYAKLHQKAAHAVTEGAGEKKKIKTKKSTDPKDVFIKRKFKELGTFENKATGRDVSLRSFAIKPSKKVWRTWSTMRKRVWEKLHEKYKKKLKEFEEEYAETGGEETKDTKKTRRQALREREMALVKKLRQKGYSPDKIQRVVMKLRKSAK